ncbi:MAG: PilZ domain-containing protein [Spirochaetes bacterium]|nr:PilZ domain-containing protein [Spirochaetota bacterium]
MTSQILLQAMPFAELPQADARTTSIMIGIIIGFFLVLILGGSIAGKKGSSGGGGYLKSGLKTTGAVKSANTWANRRKFKKMAKNIGLSSVQIKVLEELADKHKIGSPVTFFNSPKVFNITMKKAIQEYDSGAYSPEVRENYKMLLFNAKQKLDKSAATDKKITTSRQLSAGKSITITTGTGEKYSSHIVTNLKDYMCAVVPTRYDGTMLKLSKWENVKVSIIEKGDKGFFYDSKIAGYTTVKGTSCVMLQHSNTINTSKQRNFPRKELGKSCYFFKINVVTLTEGKEVVKKAIIDDNAKGRLGSVLEISAGGCSIKSPNYLNKGELIRVDIDIEKKQSVSALGKIVNTRRAGLGAAIMHVQFTRTSKKNMNSINSYIYGIGERTSILDY